MITLDDFLGRNRISKENSRPELRHKKLESRTRKEYKMEDLPSEIRKDPKKFIEKVKKLDLTVDQKILVEMIEKGTAVHKIGTKKQKVQGLEPYSSYLLLILYKSLKK
ncbi:MAG: hypothetical protein ACP5IB_08125 [Thermoplasmata archaeon]